MLYDGLVLADGSTITNAAVANGTAFPANADVGELFFRTDLDALHVYNGTSWDKVGSGGGLTSITSEDVTGALGYTPLQTIISSDVTNALGFNPAELDGNGKILSTQIPAIAVTDTYVVGSQSAMLALSAAETGDIAVRTDLNKSFILKGTSYSTLSDWQELLSPTDAVQSVNGATGVVSLTTSNITEGSNQYFTTARAAAAAPVQSVNGSTGAVTVTSLQGAAGGAGATGSVITAGAGTGGGAGGPITLTGGSSSSSGTAGDITLTAGGSPTGIAGNLVLSAGATSNGAGTAGKVQINGGKSVVGGTGGSIVLSTAASSTLAQRLEILANGAWSVGADSTATGSANQVLTSNGSGSAPTWQTVSTTNVAEGTNQYFTNARARAAISITAGTSGVTYNNSTGVLDFSNISAGGTSLPSQTGNSGKYLTTDGTNASWGTVSATVTQIPRTTTFDASAKGQRVAVSANFTIPANTYAAGDVFSFYNTGSTTLTVTQGTNLTLRQDGTTNTGNRTLLQYGICTVWFNSATEAVISGSVL